MYALIKPNKVYTKLVIKTYDEYASIKDRDTIEIQEDNIKPGSDVYVVTNDVNLLPRISKRFNIVGLILMYADLNDLYNLESQGNIFRDVVSLTLYRCDIATNEPRLILPNVFKLFIIETDGAQNDGDTKVLTNYQVITFGGVDIIVIDLSQIRSLEYVKSEDIVVDNLLDNQIELSDLPGLTQLTIPYTSASYLKGASRLIQQLMLLPYPEYSPYGVDDMDSYVQMAKLIHKVNGIIPRFECLKKIKLSSSDLSHTIESISPYAPPFVDIDIYRMVANKDLVSDDGICTLFIKSLSLSNYISSQLKYILDKVRDVSILNLRNDLNVNMGVESEIYPINLGYIDKLVTYDPDGGYIIPGYIIKYINGGGPTIYIKDPEGIFDKHGKLIDEMRRKDNRTVSRKSSDKVKFDSSRNVRHNDYEENTEYSFNGNTSDSRYVPVSWMELPLGYEDLDCEPLNENSNLVITPDIPRLEESTKHEDIKYDEPLFVEEIETEKFTELSPMAPVTPRRSLPPRQSVSPRITPVPSYLNKNDSSSLPICPSEEPVRRTSTSLSPRVSPLAPESISNRLSNLSPPRNSNRRVELGQGSIIADNI